MKASIIFLILFFSAAVIYGESKNVLFIGNSYTYENNLPLMVANLATSTGDTLHFDSNAIGGATFYAHSINTDTRNKIMAGDWDYVVLQGQSLELVGNFTNVAVSFPEVGVLNNLINQYNPCGETMFYRTWGRKNGLGTLTYQTMDSLIHVNYMSLADTFNAVVSPAGETWKFIRQNYPSIELFQTDESHPSVAGTYATACSFYSSIFRKDPVACTFNSTLSATDAANIKSIAKIIVYDSLMKWHIGEYDSINAIACSSIGIPEIENETWKLYPNPASTIIILEINDAHTDRIQLYNSIGELLREIEPAPQVRISVADLPGGLYFLRQKNKSQGMKFIKR